MVRKAERLLNLIVMLLETPRPVGIQQIHETIPGYSQDNWEAFKRMFERDKEELREMGIPLELVPTDIWNTEEGYRIPKDRYYLADLKLEPEEVAALWLAAGLVKMNDPGTFQAAALKLEHDAAVDVPIEQSRVSADLGLSSPNLAKAFEAVGSRKRVGFTYRSRERQAARKVDPYGLVHRKGFWYVVGLDHLSDEIRSFRLDRIEGSLQAVDPSRPGPDYQVPENFHADEALELPPFVQGLPIATATVRFTSSSAWMVERASPWLELEFDDTGATASVEVTDVSGFISWLLGFGESAELIAPQNLRGQVYDRLKLLCDDPETGR